MGAVDVGTLVRMRETIRHRGPDDEGAFLSDDRRVGLGSRRLAIVDVAGGAQPMFGEAGEVLVFNGEIYNYPRLRTELERKGVGFATHCDTEVILKLYALHGEDCLRYLNGMFAFALWDPRKQRLLLARDRLGEKPLYWWDEGGVLVFGSEIKALLEHPLVRPAVNEGAIVPYLANLVTPAPSTLYRGIWKLPSGTMAVCDRGGMRVERYWNLFAPRVWAAASIDDAARNVRELLERSVHDRLMSDVPLGVLLSGGIDSSTLVALLRDKARGLATFSVGFAGSTDIDERDEARWAATHFGTDHHEVVVTEEDALSFLPQLVHHQDEPLADPVCIPLHFVCKLARESGVKVVLAGEGADELFWGYPRYRKLMARWSWLRLALRMPGFGRRLLPHLVPSRRNPHVRELAEQVAAGRLLPMHAPLGLTGIQRRTMLGRPAGDLGWSPSVGAPGSDPFSTLAFDTQEYEFGLRLPELLLMRIDRFSMANSVEARVPFLDPALVEYVYRLPVALKLDGGETKVVLRRAVADVVPEHVLRRPKQGFGAPISDWFAERLGQMFDRLIEEEALRTYFDVDALRRVLATHRRRRDGAFVLWPILNFALWHRYWIEGEPLEPHHIPLGAEEA